MEAFFDAFHNAISNGDFATLKPGEHTTIPISVDTTGYKPAARSQKGWMFVNIEGRDGAAQAELIPAMNVK